MAVIRAGIKGGGERFQARAQEPLGTDSQQTISKQLSECWLLIGDTKMLCAQSANFCCALPPDPTDRHCMGLRECNNTGADYSDHAHTFRVLFVLPIETKRSEASGIIKRKWNGTVRLKQSFQSNRSEPFAFRPKFWAGSRYTK